jgi:Receptor family ligand binding region
MSTRNDTSVVLGEVSMVLLAIHHFNNKELSPIFSSTSLRSNGRDHGDVGDDEALSSVQLVSEENCNVRLTADFYDTESNAVKSTKDLSELLKRHHDSLQDSLPSAIVGAFESSVTSPLAILSSVENIAQISAGSTSDDFEDDEVYPLLARTCTSSYNEARGKELSFAMCTVFTASFEKPCVAHLYS